MAVFIPRVRGSFSDRNKIDPINTIIQKTSLDERTRNKIINIFDVIVGSCSSIELDDLYNYIFKVVFCLTNDEIPSNERDSIVYEIKVEWEYHQIFSFLEALLYWYSERFSKDMYDVFNNLFKQECVGYRFIDGKITDIINEEEVKEVETALNTKYSACNTCISKALEKCFDREKPDYSNSVKESISAIEAMCSIILGKRKPTLGDALKSLEKKGIKIHGALEKAFSILYGYTSDESGIRHNNGIDENTTFEEAKFMLVSCSAFLNYLIQIYEKVEV